LTKKFNIPSGCIINKYDINCEVANNLKIYLNDNNIELLAEIPYNNIFTEAIIKEKTIIEEDKENNITAELLRCWHKIEDLKFKN